MNFEYNIHLIKLIYIIILYKIFVLIIINKKLFNFY